MTYREYPSPRALANVIECVWTRLPDPVARKVSETVECKVSEQVPHTILPDGAIDIIATFFPDSTPDETFVVGAMTRPQFASLGSHALVGIRFLPGAGGSALGTNANALTDDQVHLGDAFNHNARLCDAFRSLRLNPASEHALHLFSKALGMQRRPIPPIVRQAAKLLSQHRAPVRVQQVARDLCVSRQHLARVFSEHSGLTPKLFAQICRVRALLSVAQTRFDQSRATAASQAVLSSSHEDSWSMLAAEFGYVDQSHLIAEVHAVIGQTPVAWQATAGSNIPIRPVPVASL
ncbi:MAG: AraC family transcriptional regulator [Gemmatimonadaceae bacterium]